MALRGDRAGSANHPRARQARRASRVVSFAAFATCFSVGVAAAERAGAEPAPIPAAGVDSPRPFVVADLSEHSNAAISYTYGTAECADCTEPGTPLPELRAHIVMISGDVALRPGLKLWASLPIAERRGQSNPLLFSDSHRAFGQLTLGIRQLWSLPGAWQPRLAAGASFSGTPRTGAGGQAGLTLRTARLVSGLHPSHFDVTTTTTRLHGDVAISRGPAMAQLGVALSARNPDERELRFELGFEAMVGARIGEHVAVMAEVTGSVLDTSLTCPSSCLDEQSGFTQLVSGNLGARATLPVRFRPSLGIRFIAPLIDDAPLYQGGPALPRDSVSPSFSVEASARF